MGNTYGTVKKMTFRSGGKMKKCNYHSFILKIKCPYYFAGDCTLEKISSGSRDCFLTENKKSQEVYNDGVKKNI